MLDIMLLCIFKKKSTITTPCLPHSCLHWQVKRTAIALLIAISANQYSDGQGEIVLPAVLTISVWCVMQFKAQQEYTWLLHSTVGSIRFDIYSFSQHSEEVWVLSWLFPYNSTQAFFFSCRTQFRKFPTL